jgi:hypothetical protein
MKKIAIIILVLGIAFSYSCKKEEGKEVSTTIMGQLRTNGTQDPIKVSVEIDNPIVTIYHEIDQVGYTSTGFEKVSSTTVDDDGNFSITLDLNSKGEYFWGVSNIDETVYYSEEPPSTWWGWFYNTGNNKITPGSTNNPTIYISALSYVRPRFINTNTDPNNNDVFDIKDDNIGPNQYSVLLADINIVNQFLPLHGKVDSLAPWIHKTWSGAYRNGVVDNDVIHKVNGKLTRNGVTRDTSIIFIVPPFDTTVVEIRY